MVFCLSFHIRISSWLQACNFTSGEPEKVAPSIAAFVHRKNGKQISNWILDPLSIQVCCPSHCWDCSMKDRCPWHGSHISISIMSAAMYFDVSDFCSTVKWVLKTWYLQVLDVGVVIEVRKLSMDNSIKLYMSLLPCFPSYINLSFNQNGRLNNAIATIMHLQHSLSLQCINYCLC